MKKSKIIVVSVLAVILCFMCVTTSTFSWFTRPQTKTGDSLGWNINYDTSVGNGVTMKTYVSKDSGNTYDETAEITSFSNSTGLGAGDRIYYRTDITNNGDSPQSVSLYLSKLTLPEDTQGSFCLGVNDPLKTYKTYGSSAASSGEKVASAVNEQNVYVALHNSEIDKLTAKLTSGYVHAWSSSGGDSDCYWSNVVDTGKTGSWDVGYWSSAQTFRIYAAKVKYSSTNFMLYTSDGWQESAKPSIASQNTIGYFEYGGTYYVTALTSSSAAGINTFYSSASITAGNTIDLAATGIGTITYSSSDTSVATVDSSGVVTGVKSGTTTITATSTGVYGDTITATCTLTVVAKESNVKSDVPIVTNLKVNGVSDVGEATTESIYWYIKNDSSAALTYTIEDVYLTL
ncbi:MAG: Ig domain-containing protein [Ruminococcus sp.]